MNIWKPKSRLFLLSSVLIVFTVNWIFCQQKPNLLSAKMLILGEIWWAKRQTDFPFLTLVTSSAWLTRGNIEWLFGSLCLFESTWNNKLIAAKYTWEQIFRGGMSVSKRLGILDMNKSLPHEMMFTTLMFCHRLFKSWTNLFGIQMIQP